jgi:hypothetical protein
MPLVDVATAKEELRVDGGAEDSAILRKLNSAQLLAENFLNRRVYATTEELATAVAAAPAALASASAAYDEALAAAGELTVVDERDLGEFLAREAYRDALDNHRRTMRGMVVTENIRTAVLLITGALWEHRGDEVELEGMPAAAKTFLWPDRIGVGV